MTKNATVQHIPYYTQGDTLIDLTLHGMSFRVKYC